MPKVGRREHRPRQALTILLGAEEAYDILYDVTGSYPRYSRGKWLQVTVGQHFRAITG